MAAYPSYAVSVDSTRQGENEYKDDFASSGTQHSRKMHSKEYFRFRVIHPALTGQQFADLKATYVAGKRDTYTGFAWYTSSPSVTYSVIFQGPPQLVENHGNNRFDVAVTLRGWEA